MVSFKYHRSRLIAVVSIISLAVSQFLVDLRSIRRIIASHIASFKELRGHIDDFIGSKSLLEEIDNPFFGRKSTWIDNNPLIIMSPTSIYIEKSHPILCILR